MATSIRLIFTLILFFFNGVAVAELGTAPLRIGKPLPDQLDLNDTSMVWMVVNFENVSSPNFALSDLQIDYEDSSSAARNDFFNFSPIDKAEGGKTSYLVGLALPVGNYKITGISGRSFYTLMIGGMRFRVEIPITVPAKGKHYYLGNVSIKNIETKNKRDQRSGYPTPLIDQIASGFGQGTLRITYSDNMESDISQIKRVLFKSAALQNVIFEKSIIPEIKVPYALGQGLDPITVRPTLQPTGFAKIEDVEAVPKLGVKGKELYVEWLSKPAPKAVAISDKGALARGYGGNAAADAVKVCESFGRPCRVYALDGDVVFIPFPAVHDTPIPMPSNYAEAQNLDAPPYAFSNQRSQYASWLEKPVPKAIAVNDSGGLFSAYGGDSMVVALDNCKKVNRPCKLYAVDSTVVFTPFPAVHSATLPEPTNFAAVTDRDALPKVSAAGRNNYDQWLQRPKPKAFAVSEKGATSYRIGPDSMAESLNGCEKFGSACRLYAVDDQVVFKPFGGP